MILKPDEENVVESEDPIPIQTGCFVAMIERCVTAGGRVLESGEVYEVTRRFTTTEGAERFEISDERGVALPSVPGRLLRVVSNG